jgi:hypothetical protein
MKMKNINYILLAASLLLMLPSCFQDLEQDPPFDYPKESESPPVGEDGLLLHLSFDEDYKDAVSGLEATKAGNPGFAAGKAGRAYAGAPDSYLTFNLSDLPETLGASFSVGFWYKVNASPDRAGIIVIGPGDNSRNHGFRLFREDASGKQRIKANAGNGTADGWLDNAKADLDPAADTWHYITLTLATGKAVLYIDGEEAATNDLAQISWNGCDIISIGSGAPRFTEWNHLSDESLIDDLRLFNKALTPEEIRAIITRD